MRRIDKLKAAVLAMTKRVVHATRSPLNPYQWACELECGHEVWVTRDRAPRRAVCTAPECNGET